MTSTFIKFLCLLPLAFCSEPRGWAFVQSTGGIALGTVSVSEGNWSLAVRADVSGLEEITVRPSLVNSALICERTTATVEDNRIFLTIHTGLLREGYATSCPPANLGQLRAGSYRVFYRSPAGEPHRLGEIVVSEATTSKDEPQ